MLWHKSWLETKFKLLMTLFFMGGFLVFFHSMGTKPTPPDSKGLVFGYLALFAPSMVILTCMWLAGAGIATQAAFQVAKGLSGSTLFTLSLPVTRFRLLAVRAAFGWLGMACALAVQCFGMWLLLPGLNRAVRPVEMFEYTGTLIVCASAVYFLSVLLATFLEDQWRMWGTMLGSTALWWIPSHTPLPASADIFRAMGETSPLLAHTMPWTTMGVSLAFAAFMFFGALKIVRAREY